MIHHFHNGTRLPVTYCIWSLIQPQWEAHDHVWAQSLGIKVYLDQPRHEFTTAQGGTHMVQGTLRIQLTTTTDRQRDMLLLKWGDRAVLMEQCIVAAHTDQQTHTP